MKPWSKQKELQQRFADVPSINEIDNMISQINYGKVNPKFQTARARALVAMYYLTACRASEIIMVDRLRRQKINKDQWGNKHGIKRWVDKHDYIGIKKRDISFDTVDDRPRMIIRTENRKNKNRKTKQLPIPIELETPIVSHLRAYTDHLEPDDILFKFKQQRAIQIIRDTLKWNIHFIRHIRATHLVTLYDFNEQLLIKFMGWTDARPAKYYMELNTKDLFRQFYKRGA